MARKGSRARVVRAQLEELSISGEETPSAWGVGIDSIPAQWSALTSLHTLQLRGHTMLSVRAARAAQPARAPTAL
jgi:hypothetical protein